MDTSTTPTITTSSGITVSIDSDTLVELFAMILACIVAFFLIKHMMGG